MFLRVSAFAVLCLTSSPAWAAPATPEGAARIEAALRTYFGLLEGIVEVMPEGETYVLTLDATPIIALGKEAGITGAASPLHLTLTDMGDGKWSVAEEEPFALTLDVPGVLSLDASTGATRFTGIYDEALLAFTSSEAGYEDFRVKERFTEPGEPETVVDYRIERFNVTTTATAAPGGRSGRHDAVFVGRAVGNHLRRGGGGAV